MSMKKSVAVLLAMSLGLSLAACASSNASTNEAESKASEASAEAENTVETTQTESTVQNQMSETTAEEEVQEEQAIEFETVHFGDSIITDFVEMTVESMDTSQELKPTDTSSVYSYMSDQDGETYFYVTGTMKNTSGDSYSVEDMNIQMTFDGKYNYTGYIAADDGGNDFYGDYVKPFGSVKYYMYASIPDELISSYSTCVIKFAFHDNFMHDINTDFSTYEHCYTIAVTK